VSPLTPWLLCCFVCATPGGVVFFCSLSPPVLPKGGFTEAVRILDLLHKNRYKHHRESCLGRRGGFFRFESPRCCNTWLENHKIWCYSGFL